MSMSDPIADMLTRIRNAQMREHKTVSIPHSNVKVAIAEVLQKEGYIEEFKVLPEEPQAVLQVTLKYVGGRRDRRQTDALVGRPEQHVGAQIRVLQRRGVGRAQSREGRTAGERAGIEEVGAAPTGLELELSEA